MGRRYSIDGSQNATAADSILGLYSVTTVKPKIYDVVFGCGAAPADRAFNMQMRRMSDAGTWASGVTPSPLDPDDPNSLCTACKYNATTEPTKGVTLLSFSINQQATFRWVVPPEEGLVAPATNNAGILLEFVVVSAGTDLCEATFLFEE